MIPIAALVLSLASTTLAEAHGIPYTKLVLDNGLQVIVHEDHTNPIVSVCVVYHVGSSREEQGKTGLAHVFEHMMFKGSQHVRDGEHAKLVKEAGGEYQASTSPDCTEYYENLPSNELELALWLESDRMGFLLPTLDRGKLANVIDVVRNERRERLDGYAEGMAEEQIVGLLYPAGHPYSWVTCGSQDDLASVNVADVNSFGERWYCPNNATLAIGGDVEVGRVNELVRKYFGQIPARTQQANKVPASFRMQCDTRIVNECDISISKLKCVWPVPALAGREKAALRLLVSALDKQLANDLIQARVVAHDARVRLDMLELGGRISIELEALPTKGLTFLEGELAKQLESLDRSLDSPLIDLVRNRLGTRDQLSVDSVSERTRALARNNSTSGRPDLGQEDARSLEEVGPGDVRSALRNYLLDRPHVVLSLVPEHHRELAARKDEKTGTEGDANTDAVLDRSKRPVSATPASTTSVPEVWQAKLDNGLQIIGITRPRSELCSISLTLPMGAGYEPPGNLGMLSLLAEAAFSKALGPHGSEWTDRWNRLGSTCDLSGGSDLTFTATVSVKSLPEAVSLLNEMVEAPDVTSEELELAKRVMAGTLYKNPRISGVGASPMLMHLLYGSDNVPGANARERSEALKRINLTDVRDFLHDHVVPRGSTVEFVGPLDAQGMTDCLAPLAERWRSSVPEPVFINPPMLAAPVTTIYLCDRSAATQSEIEIAQATLSPSDPGFCALDIGVKILGSPGINGRLNKRLREFLGYTYHCEATVARERELGVFLVSSMIDAEHTALALREMLSAIHEARTGLTEDELKGTQRASRLHEMMRFETMSECMAELLRIQRLGAPGDAARQWIQSIDALKLTEVQEAMQRGIDPGRLFIVVTGDAAKIRESLRALAVGDVIDIDGFGDVTEQPKTEAKAHK